MEDNLIKNLFFAFTLGCMLALSACSGNTADELYKTAQFEELQRNHEHARELYEQIINRFPNNEFAEKARARLAAMDGDK